MWALFLVMRISKIVLFDCRIGVNRRGGKRPAVNSRPRDVAWTETGTFDSRTPFKESGPSRLVKFPGYRFSQADFGSWRKTLYGQWLITRIQRAELNCIVCY